MVSIVFEGIFALFAAVGAATLVWMIIGIFIRPESCKGIYTYTVVAATGEEENLTKVVKSLLWRQDMLPEEREIILCGTVPGEVYDELKREAKQRAELTVLEYAEIGEYLKKQIAGNAARDTNEAGSYKAGGTC